MKKIVFWVLFVPVAIVMLVLSLIASFGMMLIRLNEVYDHLTSLFEYWAFDTPRGFYFNDPRQRTIRDVWNSVDLEYKSTRYRRD